MYCGKSRSQWPLACWECCFESRQGHGRLSFVVVVCCHAEVPATVWSLVQRSPTECGVSECDLETSTAGLGPQELSTHERKLREDICSGCPTTYSSEPTECHRDRQLITSTAQCTPAMLNDVHCLHVLIITGIMRWLILLFSPLEIYLRINRVKLKKNRSHQGGNVGWRCLRIGCWGEYLGLRVTR